MLQMSRHRTKDQRLAELHPDAQVIGQNSPPDVASNLRRMRHQQGYSLETLAKRAGVSRAMLGQIETGKSMPTIALIWKIAKALGIPVTALIVDPIEAHATLVASGTVPTIVASGGHYRTKLFSRPEILQPFDFSQVEITGGHRETIEAYAWGTRATMYVSAGAIEITVGKERPVSLTEGNAILFDADIEHTFFNPLTTDATAFLVVAPSRNGPR